MESQHSGMKRSGSYSSSSSADVLRSSCECCKGSPPADECQKRRCSAYPLVVLDNEDGKTVLHLLCQDSACSVDSVQDLIAFQPEALERKDVYGRTPLFYALKRACSLEVVIALFDHFPGAILEKDFCGDLPLYLLFHPSKDVRILQYILSQRPSLALFQENSFSRQSLVKHICAPLSTQTTTKLSRSDVESDAILMDRWTKLVLTVGAAYAHANGQKQNNTIPELHEALEMTCCSPMVLCQYIEMYPEQVSMPVLSKDGILPLHYFLTTHKVSTKGSDHVISHLIHAFPHACKVSRKGRFPLQIALSSGYTWSSGIRDVAFADSSILEKADLESGLVPFLQAALASGGDLNTSYCLLRENPSLLGTMS